MSRRDYYCEAIAESFDEHGITATAEQIKSFAADMELIYEGVSQAFYTPENPLIAENAELKRKLGIEQRKVACPRCRGTGSEVVSFGPIGRQSISQCDKCRGEGKVLP